MGNLATPKTGCTSAKFKPIGLVRHSVCTVFRDSNSVTNRSASEGRGQIYLDSAEAKPALAAEQQQYAPAFSLSAPCISPILTHRRKCHETFFFDTIVKHLLFFFIGRCLNFLIKNVVTRIH